LVVAVVATAADSLSVACGPTAAIAAHHHSTFTMLTLSFPELGGHGATGLGLTVSSSLQSFLLRLGQPPFLAKGRHGG
jgi:hypothetical protein